ncbi:MAG: DUF4350 domain-containing protein [Desulfobacterales bacterium]
MRNAKALRAIIFVVIVSGFMFGVLKLFLLRFEAGDVYPAYSSLRSDPLGSRAFYSSLENINDTAVGRNYRPLQSLEFNENTAFFYIGTSVFDSDSVSAEWFQVFERLTNAGGRLVLSFLPVEKKPANWRMSKCAAPKNENNESDNVRQKDAPDDNENLSKPHTDQRTSDSPNKDDKHLEGGPDPLTSEKQRNCVTLKEKWGLAFAFAEKPPDKAANVRDDLSAAALNRLPQTISWHTALYFDDLDDTWRVIYTADRRPVIVEKPYGSGSLVLSADSFFLSNEALRSERHPELLAWTLGQSASVVFDETHFGIFKHPGVLSLIKKHRFYWFIFTVAVLALLFIWKNSVYFVPPPKRSAAQAGGDFISDRDSTQGLISLLRRNIPTRHILQTCIREWQRTIQPEKRFGNDQVAKIKSAFKMTANRGPKFIDPVSEYRRISKIISKGRYDE